MMQSIMSNDELQNLEKAGRFRKQVDKNKEKVMDMLKMNGPEYLPIQAGKAGLVIDEPSLKRRKLEIEDLAEKAQIIKQARETQYELSMGRALLERKQGEFFEKQAAPLSKVIKDSAEQNKKQLDAINAILERKGFSEEKIQALQDSLASIVEAVDISDKLEDIKMLIADVSRNISKIPAFKDDGPAIEDAIEKGILSSDDVFDKSFLEKSFDLGTFSKAKTEGEPEAKAEAPSEWDSPKFSQALSNWMSNTAENTWAKKEVLISGTSGREQKGLRAFLTRFAEENGLEPPSEDQISSYADIAIKGLEQTGDNGFAKKYRRNQLKKQVKKTGNLNESDKMDGKGLRPISGRGWNESYQQYMASGKTIDDIARLRNNLRKDITGKGIGLRLPEDIEMFGKKLKKNFTGKGGITTEIHKDFLKKNYTIGKGMNYSKMKPEQLMKNLTLNIASMQAGNTGVKDQINSIIDQMLDRGIIKKAEHKKLWYQYCD